MRRRIGRVGAAVALATGLAVGPTAFGPAVAHGGELDVELGTDGSGGVSAALVWAGDGHPVEESAVVVVRAVSDDGDEVGPVTLESASEGVGWYRSDAELLDEGHWTVTAQVTEPQEKTVKTEIDVAAPPSAAPEPSEEPSTGTDGAGAVADGAGTGAADASETGGLPGWAVWSLGMLAVAGAVGAAIVLRRRAG